MLNGDTFLFGSLKIPELNSYKLKLLPCHRLENSQFNINFRDLCIIPIYNYLNSVIEEQSYI